MYEFSRIATEPDGPVFLHTRPRGGLELTLIASAVHTLAMVATGGAIAFVVYRYLGLGLLRRSWLNLDLLWAVLLIGVGGAALAVTAWA